MDYVLEIYKDDQAEMFKRFPDTGFSNAPFAAISADDVLSTAAWEESAGATEPDLKVIQVEHHISYNRHKIMLFTKSHPRKP
jgi:hypothetical protein